MALAVTHVLVAIIFFDLLRHYLFGKKKFPRYLVVIGGIAGLAPDIDMPLGWFISFITGESVSIHGAYTHSIVFVIMFLLVGVVRYYQGDDKWGKIFMVIAGGWFIHLGLDCAFSSYETFFWPIVFNTRVFCPTGVAKMYWSGIDAIILVVWLVHEEVHQKIKDYF